MTAILSPSEAGAVTPERFRHVLGHYPTGVSVVTSRTAAGDPVGMTIGTFTSISLEPALVGFFPAKTSGTFPAIRDSGGFCVNVVADQHHELCGRFAGPVERRFEGLEWQEAPSGAPVLADALAWIDCDIEQITDTGDHHLVVGRVRALAAEPVRRPLLFFQGGLGSFRPLTTDGRRETR
ncbi:flavin reductase family protein [Streptomyces tagetis]|uniref:Flavin reductase family protein n=1 Tax=Streptomyces tagetis TaxID=2820809 RepID=A0A941AZD4_9ACTN|nr:flavin reductase family protein [Streptomyces sp. RG38]MBQ0825251.1 flavin reductase family protein [Streptomyces sp. RG38]